MKIIAQWLIAFIFFFLLPSSALAATTPFRSASIATTNATGGFTNLGNCFATDGLTCDHLSGNGGSSLYFNGFGTYADFGVPQGSKITKVRVRVTGKSTYGVGVIIAAGPQDCRWGTTTWGLFSSQTINTQIIVSELTDQWQYKAVRSFCFQPQIFDNDKITWQIRHSSGQSWSANIDNFEIAFDYNLPLTPTPTPTPTTTPSPTPTPTPSGPEPFLDLPWDYESQGKSFEEVALDPNSWFDHQYPLQNVICCIKDIVDYTGEPKIDFYKSHNGYDYALNNGVELNTPVLAAASGRATFKSEAHSGGAGNVIKIDHGNGYQTWYEHLSIDDLIASDEARIVSVIKGQKIGKVGMTGNTNGPHIHFSVFKDSNNNGTFNDDIPYGVVDPLGWEGVNVDPWTTWTSNERTGTKSFNLFIARAPAKTVNIAVNGGSLNTDKVNINFPGGAFLEPFKVIFKDGPFESVSNAITSIAPSFFLNAINSLGQPITQFQNPVNIMYNYSSSDLNNINENSLLLYFFNELTKTWDPLTTTLDTINKIATADTSHFSHFALMGEVKDLIAPITEVTITGENGQDNWYRSNVTVELLGADNEGGIGLQYTLYTLNNSDWITYESPLTFNQEGTHKITYQSFDKADNKEERKTIEFNIDKTLPQASINANPTTIWPPNGKMTDILVTGNATDKHLLNKTITVKDEYQKVEPTISDFGQTIQLEAKRNGVDTDGRVYILKVEAEDLAGNKTEKQTQVTVPHDQGKKK